MKTMKIRHLTTCCGMALLLMAMLTLAGCRSSRSAGKGSADIMHTEYLSSKLELTIPHKDAVFTVGGTMKLKRKEMIQFSLLMPILRTEVARVQVTPDELLIVDRMNRRFVRAGDSELRYAVVSGFTYDKLEKLLRRMARDGKSKSITGEDLGLTKLKKAKVEFYDFSTDPVSISPIELSSRYKQVTLEEMLQLLTSLSL